MLLNIPRSDGCSLCADGSAPPYGDRQSLSSDKEYGTCNHVNEYTKYVNREGSGACTLSQSVMGSFCGCDQAVQPAKQCSICQDKDLEISNDPAPTFKHLDSNGETMIHQSGRSCLEAEMLANELFMGVATYRQEDSDICVEIRDQISQACCKQPITLVMGSGSTKDESSSTRLASRSGATFLIVVLVTATLGN
jgi:hypothetical protein